MARGIPKASHYNGVYEDIMNLEIKKHFLEKWEMNGVKP